MEVAIDLWHLPEDDLDVIEAALAELPTRHRGRSPTLAWLRIGEIDEAVRFEVWVDRGNAREWL
jgi:hypothetical protein